MIFGKRKRGQVQIKLETLVFAGHNNVNAATSYMRASRQQGEMVNKALGTSKLYEGIIAFSKDTFITVEQVMAADEDQQIGGIVGGILIAGIGLCKTGQKNCAFNPVTSCYGCGRYVPAINSPMHQEAIGGMRAILQKQHELGVGSPHSDLRRFKTSAGVELTTADLLFLTPYGLTDLPDSMLDEMAVTTLSQNSMYLAMGCVKSKWSYSLFARYGDASSEKHYFIKPHSLRHLLNTELFKLGVSDTVITQQFGRMSVAQSYEYDHRSLSEKLSFTRLPESAKDLVRPGSPSELVAKMVVGGMIPSSHVTKSFKAIQASSGDEVAFRYLVANSDGFHVTPYGFCLNSFSMNPCARHLKCFDRCKHYTASGLPEHRVTLETLRVQLVQARQAAAAKPAKTIGRMNQIAHADTLLAGVDAALAAAPDTPVFGGNVDHSKPIGDVLT